MKDSRVAIFRKTLESLLDSLDATLRVGRWAGPEAVPEPLKQSARDLLARLGAANRLAASRFSGSTADVERVNSIADAIRRLDAAYVVYCREREGDPRAWELAAQTLDAEIHEIKTTL
ncbi:Hypothetical protein A7982_00062 [Minicystis rosea]|nr:Hypothetical protein A7982_00062 [Minicystis rosea]